MDVCWCSGFAMEEVNRLVSTGDCVKIWDAVSMAPLEQFNSHSISHPVAQACWSSNSILMDGLIDRLMDLFVCFYQHNYKTYWRDAKILVVINQ